MNNVIKLLAMAVLVVSTLLFGGIGVAFAYSLISSAFSWTALIIATGSIIVAIASFICFNKYRNSL